MKMSVPKEKSKKTNKKPNESGDTSAPNKYELLTGKKRKLTENNSGSNSL
jgi:hypothetical protein